MWQDAESAGTEPFPCFAVRVKPRHEKRVAELLREKGYEQLLPLYQRRSHWVNARSRTVRTVLLPLFPSYVFCRFNPQGSLPVLSTPGVRNIVSFARKPVPLDENEVVALLRIGGSGLPVRPHPSLGAGTYVRLRQGPLSGLGGFLEVVQGRNNLVVAVSLLQRAVSVEVKPEWVVPVAPPPGVSPR